MKQPVDSKCRMCYKVEEHIKHIIEYIIAGCIHLHHLNTIINTVWWLVTSAGCCANIWGCRLLTTTVNNTPVKVINVNGAVICDIPVIRD